jgi:hypothetical protein
MHNQKIIDKICKCLRLAESGNAHEAASALRQAHRLMRKHGVSEAQLLAAGVTEAASDGGSRYTPSFWLVALAELVAQSFDCRVLLARRYGKAPEFRFIGLDFTPELASYSFSVLSRQLEQARKDFLQDLAIEDPLDRERRGEVFAQAWLFRVARTVAEFVGHEAAQVAADAYIREQYGETLECMSRDPVAPQRQDYADILSGMRAADEVALYRSMARHLRPALVQLKRSA